MVDPHGPSLFFSKLTWVEKGVSIVSYSGYVSC